MADLLLPSTDELCYLSVQDVRDSLKWPFLDTATPLITDDQIGVLIVKAQDQINYYLNSINPDIPCCGLVDTTLAEQSICCSKKQTVLLSSCDDIPLKIRRATLQLVDNIYTEETVDDNIDPTAETMEVGDIVREKQLVVKKLKITLELSVVMILKENLVT